MSIISIITDPGVGGTFLTWSLEWLSGHEKYFYYKKKQPVMLPDCPLTDINAHKFKPNQPTTLPRLELCYSLLELTASENNHFVYFHNLNNEDLSYPPHPSLDQTAAEIAFAKSIKCIVLGLTKKYFLYRISARGRNLTHKFGSPEINQTFDEQNENFLDYFYANSKTQWEHVLKLNDIWDRREFLALNLRPFDQPIFDRKHLAGREYFLLHTEDCWLSLDHTIQDLFQYIGKAIDQRRWDQWLNVYRRWQMLHSQRIKFAWYFEDIVDAIITGNNMELGRFDLDLYQEAVIQHVLLYQHNLNIKTHNLKKFHSTAQLHNLLEPNIYHNLEKIY